MTDEQTPFDAALEDLLAQIQKQLGPDARAILSANTAHKIEDPEGGAAAELNLRDKARSKRRGRGREKALPGESVKEQVFAYYSLHDLNATMAHFEGKAKPSTIIEYTRQFDKSQRK